MRNIILGLCSIALLQSCSTTPKPTQHQTQATTVTTKTPSAKAMFLESEDVGSKGLSVVPQTSEPSSKHKSEHGPITKYQGLSYWIERIDRSDTHRVTASTVFHNGDRIRFHLRSNRSGYLYVVTQGSSGRSAYLFPSKISESEYIEANHDYTIPSQASIVFDAQPGKEVIWLFLSKQALPVSNSEQTSSQTGTPSSNLVALNSCGSKDLLIASPESIQNQCGPKTGGQAKDILIQDDTTTAEPTGYAVISQQQIEQGAMLTLKLELRHE